MASRNAVNVVLICVVFVPVVSETSMHRNVLLDGFTEGLLRGSTEAQNFHADDTPSALDALDEDVLSTSFGSDRLYADKHLSGAVGESELGDVRKELAEARTEVRFQANIMKNMLAEVHGLKAGYKRSLRDQAASREPDWLETKTEIPQTDGFSAATDEPVESTNLLMESKLRREPDVTTINDDIDKGPLSDQLVTDMELLPRENFDSYSSPRAKDIADDADSWNEDTPARWSDTRHKNLKRLSFLATEGELLASTTQPATAQPSTTPLSTQLLLSGVIGGEDDGVWSLGVKWGPSGCGGLILQFVIGIIYYFLVVQHFPRLRPGERIPGTAEDLQKMNPLIAVMQVSPKVCICAFCCPSARAAHTFESAGVLNYWLGLLGMLCVPCCTLWLTSAFTDLNQRLGGEPNGKWGAFGALLSACICGCCLIAQDAESLDLVAGVRTGFFSAGAYQQPNQRWVQ